MKTRLALSMLVATMTSLAACGDDFGGTLSPSEALSRQQQAATARSSALMCATAPTFSQMTTGTECSLADVNTCVGRITAAAACDGINTAYLGCTVRCR